MPEGFGPWLMGLVYGQRVGSMAYGFVIWLKDLV